MDTAQYLQFITDLLAGSIQAVRLDDATNTYEDPNVIAVGGIYQTTSTVDPGLSQALGGLGYGAWARFGLGRVLIGVDEGDPSIDIAEAVVGAKTSTPTGAVSAPTFTGTSAQATSAVSAGTPSGSCSAPTFTGSALGSHTHTFTGDAVASTLVSAGTPSGSCSAPTFTGNAVASTLVSGGTPAGTVSSHAHELPFQLTSATTTRQLAAATFGTGTSRAAQGQDTAHVANTTSAAVALSQAVAPTFTGSALATHQHSTTATGSVTAPTFTGSALATHQHSTTATGTNAGASAGTPAGSVSAPTFTGSALGSHSHTVTPAGTVSAPTFTGDPVSVVQPSIAVYIWRRTS